MKKSSKSFKEEAQDNGERQRKLQFKKRKQKSRNAGINYKNVKSLEDLDEYDDYDYNF